MLYNIYSARRDVRFPLGDRLSKVHTISQQKNCSDSLLTSSSLHSAVTITAPHHRCIYCHPDKAQTLTRQCNRCYSDFILVF
jgi:hypothetical protein